MYRSDLLTVNTTVAYVSGKGDASLHIYVSSSYDRRRLSVAETPLSAALTSSTGSNVHQSTLTFNMKLILLPVLFLSLKLSASHHLGTH